jgi:hypothetical protein
MPVVFILFTAAAFVPSVNPSAFTLIAARLKRDEWQLIFILIRIKTKQTNDNGNGATILVLNQ